MNVVLYVLDALRADHLSCYGYERDTSPNIDELAVEGVRFERCFTPATWTRPVAASLLSGSYPPTHGTETRQDRFSPHVPSLAEQFQSVGFETVGITTMGNVSSTVGFDRGFDRFYDLYKDERVIEKRRTSTVTDEELKQEEVTEVALPRAEDITDSFRRWLTDRKGDTPFFAFMWSIEPHIPYDPPERFRAFADPDYDGPVDGKRESLKHVDSPEDVEHLKALYDGEIAYNDACIGDIAELLQDNDEFEDTLFVVIGDHGDAFSEHDRLTHGHAPYDELIHVPCVVRTPSEEIVDAQVNAMCSLIDLYPTLLDHVADEEYEPDRDPDYLDGIQGESLVEALNGREIQGKEYVFSKTTSYNMQNTFYGVRSSDWKYIEVETPDRSPQNLFNLVQYVFEKGLISDILRNPRYYLNRYRYSETEFLYQLTEDPEEQQNIAASETERCAEFEELLTDWEARCKAIRQEFGTDDVSKKIDAETQEQLRQLGYTE